jgi:hypothetical protein
MSEWGAGYRGTVGNPHADALGHHRWRVRSVPAISHDGDSNWTPVGSPPDRGSLTVGLA